MSCSKSARQGIGLPREAPEVRISTCVRTVARGMERSREQMPTTHGKWFEFLLDPRGLNAIYEYAPELHEVHEVRLVRDGPCLELRIELDRLPAKLPKKWAADLCNRVHVVLQIIGVRDISISAWGTDNLIATKFEGYPNDFTFAFEGQSTRITGAAVGMAIQEFNAYQSG